MHAHNCAPIRIEQRACRNIPQSLLLLSRAFKITTASAKPIDTKDAKDVSTQTLEALRNTFNMLPEETIADVEMEKFKSTTSLEKRLEYLQRVEKDIKDENATEKDLASAREVLEVRAHRLFRPSFLCTCSQASQADMSCFWLVVRHAT
jgi:DUF4097 and DUF4098 domain-containing protein YvlB